jgi:putative DNA primase/helicase
MTDTGVLEAALAYAQRGWAVFPTHTMRGDRCSCGSRDCGSPGKHPHTKQGLKEATLDEAQIRDWWRRWRDANIGVATGEISGLVVLDVDGQAGEQQLEVLEAEFGELPDTARTITGGDGLHYLFAHPGEIIRNTASKKLGPGLDVRGDGGYIVVPPSLHWSGQRYEWLDERDPEPMPLWLLEKLREPAPVTVSSPHPRSENRDRLRDGGTPYGLEALNKELDDLRRTGEGGRNQQLNESAFALGQLVAGGELDQDVVVGELHSTGMAIGLGEVETEKTLRSGLESGKLQPRTAPERLGDPGRPRKHLALVAGGEGDPTPPSPEDDDSEPGRDDHLTDLGNARRLVAQHGADFRYVPQWGTWITWTGRRWRKDVTGEIHRRAKQVAEDLWLEAAQPRDSDDRKRWIAWAMKSESDARLRAMVAVASTEPTMPVEPHELDADPWKLVVANGTIDLHTGELGAHRRDDLATKMVAVAYDPDAHLEMWDRFLAEATNHDDELVDFLQRSVGYSLTGDISEEVLFFVHGPAAAGKSTFMDAIQMTLGDYAVTADFKTFLEQKGAGGSGGNASPDVARLAGARFVKSVEVSEGQKLAEGLVKNLTGGDVVTARFLYQAVFEFRPQFKLWLAANAAPRIDHEDDAIWRRILRVPFEHTVPKERRDPKVKATLKDPHKAGPAILAWAVRGCLEWQQRRLGVPTVVEEATRALRAEMDPLHDWLEDRCVFDDEQWVTTEHLWDAYKAWTKSANAYTMSRKTWAKRLATRGPKSDRVRVDGKLTRIWRGIGLQQQGMEDVGAGDATVTRSDVTDEALFDPVTSTCDTTRADDVKSTEVPHESVHTGNSCEPVSSARVTSQSQGARGPDSTGMGCARCGSDDRVLAVADGSRLCKGCRVKVGEELLEKDRREKGTPEP